MGLVEHTFKGVAFIKTTTHAIDNKSGRRKKSGKVVKVTTTAPLDKDTLARLNEECQNRNFQSDSE